MAKNNIQEQASHWVSLEIDGKELKNNKEFNIWIETLENKTAFEEQKDLINGIKSLPKDFLDELKNEVKQNREIENRRKIFLKRVTPLIAASILAIFYISFFVEFPKYSKEYSVSNKIQNNILLPDNSKISLDANTTITVKYYKNRRVVELSKGKAIFDISSNKEQPFIINTEKIDIEVLGTKFEVVNFENKLQVNVLEGIVKVSKSKEKNKELAIVEKGQSLQLDNNANIISQNSLNIEKMLQWNEGKYNFQQTNLEEVFNEFSKHLDINIIYEKEKAKRYQISGNFDVKHFDNFLNVLPMIHPIKIVKQDKTIVVK